MGTVGYMSPEQVRGRAGRSPKRHLFARQRALRDGDGRRAFARDTAADTMTAILREQPGRLRSTRGDIPSELRRIVTRCLEKNPGRAVPIGAGSRHFYWLVCFSGHSRRGTHRRSVERRTRLRWVAVGSFGCDRGSGRLWFASRRDATATVDEPRIVVLPFENVGSPDDEYFATALPRRSPAASSARAAWT